MFYVNKNVINMKEEFRIYKETNNIRWGRRTYEVSNEGNVKINGCIVDFSSYNSRYYAIASNLYVHRMVAELFVPNTENKPEVDHINRNSHDNRAVNLRWVTHAENMQNKKSLIGKNNPMYGYKYNEEERKEQSKRMKKRFKDPNERIKCASRKDKKMMTDGNYKLLVHKDYWGEFIDIGFRFTSERSIFK